MLKKCNLCYRKCGCNRVKGETGYCNASNIVKVARATLHHFEEPCISGENGSGTIFFSHCNLHCVYCQNHYISQGNVGKEITIEKLSEIIMEQQNRGAHNINLVTPTHYVPQILDALKLAKTKGLSVPIVYNTNSYETTETIKSLQSTIDIYLPDLKYFDDKYSIKYSNAPNYFQVATKAIDEMYKQVGAPKFDKDGLMTKGVIVRHLMLPGLLFDSKKIIDYLFNTYGDSIYISLMNQYTPVHLVKDYDEINKPLNPKHYDALIDYALQLGIKNAFIQEDGTCKESFIPEFDLSGI